MTLEHWIIQLLQQYGLPMGMVAFFIWRDWKREKSMSITIENLNKEIRVVLKELVTKCTVALVDNTNVIKKCPGVNNG